MPLPAQSILGWHVSISILHIIAITSTLVRLVHRRRRLDLWWDDWVTILPLICDILYFVIMRLKIQHKLNGALFTSFWFECILFITIIWVSRTSLALSIARIFPPRHLFRRIALSLTGVFLFLWVALTLKSSIECYDGSSHEWWDAPLPLCFPRRPTSKAVIYIVVTSDYLADIVLIIAPISMLWSLKLPVVQRRLVLVLFSCSFITLASSAFFSSLGLVPMRDLGPDVFLLMDMVPQLMGAASIIVCNLMVLATLIYRISRKRFAPQILKPPPVQQNGPRTATPLRAATGRRETSVIRDDFRPRFDGQNGTAMAAADVASSANRTESIVPTSFTVPSFAYKGSETATGDDPSPQFVHSDPQCTNSRSGSLYQV